jgi:hypothetical protein
MANSKFGIVCLSTGQFSRRFQIPALSVTIVALTCIFVSIPLASALVENRDNVPPGSPHSLVGSALTHSRKILNHHTVVSKAASPTEQPSNSPGLYASFFVPLLAGGAATAFGDIVVHPLDTIKTVQQA